MDSECIRPIVVGIGGATRSGKSTLCRALYKKLNSPVDIVQQDHYVKVVMHIFLLTFQEELAAIVPELNLPNFETPECIDWNEFLAEVQYAINAATIQCKNCGNSGTLDNLQPNYVLVEGYLIFSHPSIHQFLDRKLFIEISRY